jgi:hypothetical protein
MKESQSQNECIGFISGSLCTQENRRGIEECIGENNEKGCERRLPTKNAESKSRK